MDATNTKQDLASHHPASTAVDSLLSWLCLARLAQHSILQLSNGYCRTLLKFEGARLVAKLQAPASEDSMVLVLDGVDWWDVMATRCPHQRCYN